MAEKKATANEQATQNVDNLVVERETFESKDGREMYGYYVAGKVRGRDVKVDLVAKDQGGYEILDIIFDIKPTADLILHDEEMTNDDGSKMKYTVYEVQNIDEDGIKYTYKVKPARDSDKTILDILLQQRAKAKEKAKNETTAA